MGTKVLNNTNIELLSAIPEIRKITGREAKRIKILV